MGHGMHLKPARARTFSVARVSATTCVVRSVTPVVHTAPHASARRHSGCDGRPEAAGPTRLKVMCMPARMPSRCSCVCVCGGGGQHRARHPVVTAGGHDGCGVCANNMGSGQPSTRRKRSRGWLPKGNHRQHACACVCACKCIHLEHCAHVPRLHLAAVGAAAAAVLPAVQVHHARVHGLQGRQHHGQHAGLGALVPSRRYR